MAQPSLSAVTHDLMARGVDARPLLELELELALLERPPGLLGRLTIAAREAAAHHWKNFMGELGESREAMAIIAARVRGDDISAEDRDKVRAQLLDLVRVFPASLIAAANSALPVPGTGMFTPWILIKLGLMPSRWREAYLIERLRKERDRLWAAGCEPQADALDRLREEIEREADAREHARHDAHLLTHWDANRNGQWDPAERAAYQHEVARVRVWAARFATRKQWFFDHEGEIFGALRLSELLEDDECRDHLGDDGLLVCFAGKSGWVCLADLLGRARAFD